MGFIPSFFFLQKVINTLRGDANVVCDVMRLSPCTYRGPWPRPLGGHVAGAMKRRESNETTG